MCRDRFIANGRGGLYDGLLLRRTSQSFFLLPIAQSAFVDPGSCGIPAEDKILYGLLLGPFEVLDDEAMQRTAERGAQIGVLAPLVVRPRGKGGYEVISGRRRKNAAELAGLKTLTVIVRNMDDDQAVILMVDSNLQHQSILSGEQAFAYKLRLEAIKIKVPGRIQLCSKWGRSCPWTKKSPRMHVKAATRSSA